MTTEVWKKSSSFYDLAKVYGTVEAIRILAEELETEKTRRAKYAEEFFENPDKEYLIRYLIAINKGHTIFSRILKVEMPADKEMEIMKLILAEYRPIFEKYFAGVNNRLFLRR